MIFAGKTGHADDESGVMTSSAPRSHSYSDETFAPETLKPISQSRGAADQKNPAGFGSLPPLPGIASQKSKKTLP